MTVTSRQIAFRNARREADANRASSRIIAAALSGLSNGAVESDHEIDQYGRKARISKPTYEEVRHFLIGNRVVDSIDMVEQIGAAAMATLINSGHLTRSADHSKKSICNLYWVNTAAQAHYKLPAKINLGDGIFVAYKEA